MEEKRNYGNLSRMGYVEPFKSENLPSIPAIGSIFD
jgi:hypothetical protein